ncbi:PREDICTED: uncharacterized protein LOC109332464 [Lupinus angustifolius]|uniref:uncharacterized protein LOC109332464 n=1 Tax=Lupinus angustifolius TaxID=3871 RepID=UPI00092E4539|nr:PREDICTED: uncharacterized protein LOC109332464 [Lupinus angustifolius]
MIECPRYICNKRPNIAYGVGLMSKYMESPRKSNLLTTKRILRYVKGTIEHGLMLPSKTSNTNHNMLGFSDTNWCGDKSDRMSTTDYVFMLGGTPISLCSKKQDVVALFLCEAEYIAACQTLWLEKLLGELKVKDEEESMQLRVDKKISNKLGQISSSAWEK